MKALFTNNHMKNFGGSELVTLELAEEFQRRGWEVLIYTHELGGPLEITVPVTTKRPNPAEFDLLWIHHNMLIHDLGFRKCPSQRIVFNHMSSYVEMEWPRLPSYEMAIADTMLANSEETRGVLGLQGVKLFQSPAPIAWEAVGAGDGPTLIVSNHAPAELLEAVPESARVGTGNPVRMSPRIISKHRAVVCNGKTVQYALRAGVPVYLYDQFGGCGWLTADNFKRAEWFNFSGRGFGRKSVDEIRAELATIPEPLLCPDRFKLDYCYEEILHSLWGGCTKGPT